MLVPDQFASMRVTVMGLGRFGGGLGVTRWLIAQGADVLLTDLESADDLAAPLAELKPLIDRGVLKLRLGEHTVSDFTDTDLVIANPAVPKPWENRFLRAASAAGVPITTEIRLAVERLPDRRRVIAVTGTVGKSTTSAMIANALSACGRRVHFGGNIGGSLLPRLGEIGPSDLVVLELSSAMLHWLRASVGDPAARGWSPGIAVVTNIAPNHLDWHADMAHYIASKQQILRDQHGGDGAVLHAALHRWIHESGRPATDSDVSVPVRWVNYSDLEWVGPLAIPGRHNQLNAAFALTVAGLIGVDPARAKAAVAAFPGLPHRLEAMAPIALPDAAPGAAPVRAFNDSKSTTPESAALAILALADDASIGAAHLHLICGGYDKKIDLAPMIAPAARCAHVWTIGATGLGLTQAIRAAGGRAAHLGTLADALRAARAVVRPGNVVLLSPGCASWDQFENYEQRGEQFRQGVRSWSGTPQSADPENHPKAS